jgi:enoyl-CoA hydratase/carnithine racemase
MSLVNLERDGALAVIAIDNPPQNRITEQMSSEFLAVLDTIEADDVPALLLTTKGPDFCFGGDIMPWPEMSNRQLRAVFERHMTVFNRFERLPIPVVAAVQGLCFGGGLELAIRADMIAVGETSRSTCRGSRPMTRAAASGRRFEGAPSHGSDHELITCRYEASL